MATFSVVILPAKKMANGKHKVRIMVSHNSQTRYIVTDIILDSPSELKNGKVVKRPDKDVLNLRIKKIYDMYFERYIDLEFSNSLTCSQLVKVISNPSHGERHRKFQDVAKEYIAQIDREDRKNTFILYKLATNKFVSFIGNDMLIEHITPTCMNQYIQSLGKLKLSNTTINIYVSLIKAIINYAIKMGYASYHVNPFITARIPSAQKRETQITVEELKKLRDLQLKKYNLSVARDIFMLTYYLAGMNLVDLLGYDFRTEEINYNRKKTQHRKNGNTMISFQIPEEARPIIKKYMNKNTGRIEFGKYKNYLSCSNLLARKIKEIGKMIGIKHDFTLYSARKSFVQHGYDLGIPLSTLEYCIGQSMKENRPIFNYVTIMKKHADKAIREILDNLK